MSELTGVALRKAARLTLPIYREIANNRIYRARIVRAIRRVDLDELRRLYSEVTSQFNSVGTNTFGFTIGFEAPSPANQIENATTTRGGARLTTNGLGSLSRRVLRWYRQIVTNASYANQLVAGARGGNQARLRALVAPYFTVSSLVSVRGDRTGIMLEVRAGTGTIFVNQFFVL